MSTKKERARAIAEWLKDATPQQIVERIEASELNSLLWHVATLTMSRDEIARAENVGEALLAGGYEGHIRGD